MALGGRTIWLKKNRFSRLLKHLLAVAEMKNYTLAQQLRV